jgi:hypothetical protein
MYILSLKSFHAQTNVKNYIDNHTVNNTRAMREEHYSKSWIVGRKMIWQYRNSTFLYVHGERKLKASSVRLLNLVVGLINFDF